MDKISQKTPDLTQENIAKIAALFPDVVTEALDADGNVTLAVDFDALRDDLSGEVVDGPRERYQFTWPGKREAKLEARRPIKKTMRPCPEKSKNWDTTENLYIEGDNLEALKIMRETYAGKVKLIYIDPPYNTGHDFVYDDDFSQTREEYDAQSGDYNEEGGRLVANPESNGRFHSDWCSMMYPRLLLAKDMLVDDGFLLLSIGDRELPNSIKLLDEVFGENNQACIFTWKSRSKPTNAGNARFRPQKVAEYVLAYGRSPIEDCLLNVVAAKSRTYPHSDELGAFRTSTILTSNRGTFRRETMRFESNGYTPSEDQRWKAGKETIDRLFKMNHMWFNADGDPMEKKYEHEEADPLYPIYTLVDTDLSGTAELGKRELSELIGNGHGFDTVKPVSLLKYLFSTFADKDSIILDFFSGSATTGQAVIELNAEDGGERRVVLVQYPEPMDGPYETISLLGQERLRKIGENIALGQPQLELGLESVPVPDIGFRVLRVDESCLKDEYAAPDQYDQAQLDLFADNAAEGAAALDLLFQVLPAFRIEYSAKITECEFGGKACFDVNDGQLIACFDEDIDTEALEAIARECPLYAVFRDACFSNDAAVANLEELFKTFSPDTIRKVI